MIKMDVFNLNSHILTMEGSASIEVKRMADELCLVDEDIVDLTLGEPCFDTDLAICDAAYNKMREGDTHYITGKGKSELRNKIAVTYHNGDHICDPETIFITPGAKYAIYMLLRVILNNGDHVMVLDPSWVSYEQIIRACSAKSIHVTLPASNQYQFTKDLLKPFVTDKVKVLIINNPNNPTGRVLNKKEMDDLIDFAKEYNIFILSDEIYDHIVYQKEFISFETYRSQYNAIAIVNGFSKSYAMTGWRIGYCIVPQFIITPLYRFFSHTITGISGFVQEAAIVALDHPEISKQMTDYYQGNCELFVEAVREYKGITVVRPEGTFYLWIYLNPDIYHYDNAAKFLLENAKIVGVDGEDYGKEFASFVRLSAATSKSNIEKAIKNLSKLKLLEEKYE